MIQFGTEGWRGIVGEVFNKGNIGSVAQGIAQYIWEENLSHRPLIIGYDTRPQSFEGAWEIAQVIAGNGIPVMVADRYAPTPAIGFSVIQFQGSGGVVVTASHNSLRYNGIKFKASYGGSVSNQVAAMIEDRANTAKVKRITIYQGIREGLITVFDPGPCYLDRVASLINGKVIAASRLYPIIDPMYGASCTYWVPLLETLGIDFSLVRGEPDLSKIDCSPEPIEANLGPLQRVLLKQGGDLGVAVDGDGDRLGAIDHEGQFVNAQQIFALLLLHLAENKKIQGKVVKTFSVSTVIDRIASELQLPLIETPVGFKHIAPLMVEGGVLIGGEESGGIAFAGHIPERDGIVTCLLLMEYLATTGLTLREALEQLEQRFGPLHQGRRDLSFSIENIQSIQRNLRQQQGDSLGSYLIHRVETLDGLKLHLQGGWILFRPSGTEPVVRIYGEHENQSELKQILDLGEEWIRTMIFP